jgi:hypothetical protein
VPFPLSLFAHEGMPYTALRVPDAGLGTQATLDTATQAASHEYVEAVTDPFPFWGWSDPTHQPVAKRGEIGDLCEGTGVIHIDGVALDRFYWTPGGGCFPSMPTVSIQAPLPNALVAYSPGVTSVNVSGAAWDPIDGDASGKIAWSVDGAIFSSGAASTSPAMQVGTHTIRASVTDSEGNVGYASVDVDVGVFGCTSVSSCTAGSQCGQQPDGCGGWVACGRCAAGQSCNASSNRCTACVPKCGGKRCGAGDGCGGSCTGTCAKAGYVCDQQDDGSKICVRAN